MDPISNKIIYKRELGFYFWKGILSCLFLHHRRYKLDHALETLQNYKGCGSHTEVENDGGGCQRSKKLQSKKKRKIHHHECERLGFPHTMTPWHDTTLYFGEIILLDT